MRPARRNDPSGIRSRSGNACDPSDSGWNSQSIVTGACCRANSNVEVYVRPIISALFTCVLAVGLSVQPAFAKNCRDDSQCSDNEVCRTSKSAKTGAKVCTQVV